jgi:hypothetical protein
MADTTTYTEKSFGLDWIPDKHLDVNECWHFNKNIYNKIHKYIFMTLDMFPKEQSKNYKRQILWH